MKLQANPYLAKAGEPIVPIRVATCAISGGFIHLNTALDNHLFDKYGLKPELLLVRGAGISAAALTANELQFLYCTADAIIPSLAAGAEAKMIASPLIGLPWVIIARKDIKRIDDLKGKIFIATRPGGTPDTLIRALMKKLNFSADDLKIRHIGGAGQTEIYTALQQDLGQATMVTPPLDARAKRDGLNVIYHLDDLNLPAIYSSVFANDKCSENIPRLSRNLRPPWQKPFFLSRKIRTKPRHPSAKCWRSKTPNLRNPPTTLTPSSWSTAASRFRLGESPKRSTICVSRAPTYAASLAKFTITASRKISPRAASSESSGVTRCREKSAEAVVPIIAKKS